MASSNTAVRKPPRISAQNAAFATVLVGIAETPFVVHEELLTYHSPFFRAALTGEFEEASSKTVRLEDGDITMFEHFVHWLYRQRFPNKHDDPDFYEEWAGDDDFGALIDYSLVRLHVFCDTYNVPVLKLQTLDRLFELTVGALLPAMISVRVAFNNLPEDSALCLYLVDLFCDRAADSNWTVAWSGFGCPPPTIFLKLVMQRYSQISQRDRPTRGPLELCQYHEHKDSEERDACAARRAA